MIVATHCYGVGLLSAYPIGKIMISTCMTAVGNTTVFHGRYSLFHC